MNQEYNTNTMTTKFGQNQLNKESNIGQKLPLGRSALSSISLTSSQGNLNGKAFQGKNDKTKEAPRQQEKFAKQTLNIQVKAKPREEPKTSFNIFCDDDDDVTDKENSIVETATSEPSFGDDSLRILEQAEALLESSPDRGESIKECPVSAGEISVCESFDDHLEQNFREYSHEVFTYLLKYQHKFRVDASYMTRQPEVNTKMRTILVDWMVEVSDEYKLHEETLFLAINLIDRFLSSMSIARQSFQLLGAAALFISSKYEEIYPPDINEFVYITDDSYTKLQVLNMEKLLLKSVKFDVSAPTVNYFLKQFLCSLELPEYVKHLAEYLSFLSLLEGEQFFKYLPSEIAISCIIVAVHTFSLSHLLSSDLIDNVLDCESKITGESLATLKLRRQMCIQELLQVQKAASEHPQQAIYQRYSTDKFFTVACIATLDQLSFS